MAGEGEAGEGLLLVLTERIKGLNLKEEQRLDLTERLRTHLKKPYRVSEALQKITESHLVDASVKWLTRAAVHVGVPFGAAYGLAAAFPTAAGTDIGLAAGLTLAILALEKNKQVSALSSWVGDRAGDAMGGLTTRIHGMQVDARIKGLAARYLSPAPAIPMR